MDQWIYAVNEAIQRRKTAEKPDHSDFWAFEFQCFHSYMWKLGQSRKSNNSQNLILHFKLMQDVIHHATLIWSWKHWYMTCFVSCLFFALDLCADEQPLHPKWITMRKQRISGVLHWDFVLMWSSITCINGDISFSYN